MVDAAFWRERRVLVTGATGLIGSWLVKELLAREAHVIALIRDPHPHSELFASGDVRRISVVNGSLEDYGSVERAITDEEASTVFHLGAQTIVGTALRAPLATFEANIRGTYNLLDACRVHASLVQQVVVASSDKAYGEQPVLPYTEDMHLEGRHPYDVSKSCTDLISQAYFHTYALPLAIVRCGNVFGGGDLNWSRVVPGAIRAFCRGESFSLRSDGKFVRDYIYVKDVARAYLRTAEALGAGLAAGNAFNFATGSPVTVLDLVQSIQGLMGCEHLEIRVLNQAKAEIRDQYLATAKARALLGWEQQFTLAEGLRETIAWYRAFLGSH